MCGTYPAQLRINLHSLADGGILPGLPVTDLAPGDAGEVPTVVDGSVRWRAPSGGVTSLSATAPVTASSSTGAVALSLSTSGCSSTNVLTYNGSAFVCASASGGFTAGGDLSGTSTSQTVNQARGGALTFGSSTDTITCNAAGTACGLAQTSTNVATGSSLTLTPQASTNTNGTPGSVIAALSTPTGTGSEAGFQVTRGGYIIGQIEAYPSISSLGLLWLGYYAGGNTTSNYIVSNYPGSNTNFNGSAELALNVNGGNEAILSTSGVQFFGSNALYLGGGSGIIGVSNYSSPSTSGCTGGFCLEGSGGRPLVVSANFARTIIAPDLTGTVNTQLVYDDWQDGVVRMTAASTAYTLYTYNFVASTTNVVDFKANCRVATVLASGAVGDSYDSDTRYLVKNVSGTISIVGTGTTIDSHADTSMSSTAVPTPTISGTTLAFKLTSPSTATTGAIDCRASILVQTN